MALINYNFLALKTINYVDFWAEFEYKLRFQPLIEAEIRKQNFKPQWSDQKSLKVLKITASQSKHQIKNVKS